MPFPSPLSRAGAAALSLLAASLLSCADGSARYEINYAPGFTEGPRSLSLFGVYQDGRMSQDAWEEIGAKLSPSLGAPMCEAAYGDKLRAADPDRFIDIDKATQSDGITEDLLDKLVPAAQGDTIAVVSLHIKNGAGQRIDGSDPSGVMTDHGRTQMPGSRMRQPNAPTPVAPGTWQLGEIRLAATLFSVKNRSTTARITMIYTGNNLDEAIKKFVEKIGASLPGSSCRGWKWGGA